MSQWISFYSELVFISSWDGNGNSFCAFESNLLVSKNEENPETKLIPVTRKETQYGYKTRGGAKTIKQTRLKNIID